MSDVTDLALPECFRGRWQNALVMTYNADIPFFERAVWSQLGSSCRNKIILADGHRFLASCADWAREGTVRYLNQLYVGAGIFVPQAAHAKLILLTNEERGRLLIGSGNLSMNGYASGGESFSQYEYAGNDPSSLSAFLAVREFLTELAQRGYVSGIAASRINHLLESTPWLYQQPAGEQWQPVRHNLHANFLAQFQDAIGEQKIEELWLHAPFHDLQGVALERMLHGLQPETVHLLIQPGRTSLNPTALERIKTGYGERFTVYEVRRRLEERDPYIHAKFYIAKLKDKALCLHGSPNLSQVALLMKPKQGNIELANLLVGSRDAFDSFLNGLHRQPFRRPLMELQSGTGDLEEEVRDPLASWYLTAGEWSGLNLVLHFHGSPPTLHQLELMGATTPIPFTEYRLGIGHLDFDLAQEGAERLNANSVVRLRWVKDDEITVSNPIFVCDHSALNRALEGAEGTGGLEAFGALELEDEEIEQLLADLNASFPIDRSSIWQLAGRQMPNATTEEEEELRLDYADIDRDALRRHPRLQQYFRSAADGSAGVAPTRLQIVLNMINAHFRLLQNHGLDARTIAAIAEAAKDSDADSEAERVSDETETQQRRLSSTARIRRLVHRFIERFLRGLSMPDFQELVGYEVVANNSRIFQHLLWRFMAKEWANQEFLTRSLLRLWVVLWGDGTGAVPGYLAGLPTEQNVEAVDLLKQNHADSERLAALAYCCNFVTSQGSEKSRLALRDFCRSFVCRVEQLPSEETVIDAWRYLSQMYAYNSPLPTELVTMIAQQCAYETESTFLRGLENRLRLPSHSCRFVWETVHRPKNAQAKVRCLKISSARSPLTIRDAAGIIALWRQTEPLDYYRVSVTTRDQRKCLIFLDLVENLGLFRLEEEQAIELTSTDFEDIGTEWSEAIHHLFMLAECAEERLTMPIAYVSSQVAA